MVWLKNRMADKTFQVWLFPILSLSVVPVWFSLGRRLNYFSYLDLWMAAHEGRLRVVNWRWFFADAIFLLLVALFGFLRAKPKEIWSYGLLMGAPILLFTLANLPDDEAKFTFAYSWRLFCRRHFHSLRWLRVAQSAE
jgi:hypothetical protein